MSQHAIGLLLALFLGAGHLCAGVFAQSSLANTFVRDATNKARPDHADLSSPESVLAAFYSAINEKDYASAFGYWETPPTDLQNFSRGYADTMSVRLLVGLPVYTEGAAGSSYADVSAIIVSRLRSGRQRIFVGCYTMRKSNLSIADNPDAKGWRIYKASVSLASDNASLSSLLDRMCQNRE